MAMRPAANLAAGASKVAGGQITQPASGGKVVHASAIVAIVANWARLPFIFQFPTIRERITFPPVRVPN